MWTKWLPWRFIVRRIARSRGFLDPLWIYSRVSRFAQPAEVTAPTELLRAAVVLHARGLMNSQAIQHNRDWIWPYWVERQFDPQDCSFIPRAFSITHINLTHRNWTAVGWPDFTELPIVDPRGLVTPFLDGWSLDSWLISEGGPELIPSRAPLVSQELEFEKGLSVVTSSQAQDLRLESRAFVSLVAGIPHCHIALAATAQIKGWLVVALRPYNPEGVSFIHSASLLPDRLGWKIDEHERVYFSEAPDRTAFSRYAKGDVHSHLFDPETRTEMECNVGLATAAALYRIEPTRTRSIEISIPLSDDHSGSAHGRTLPEDWNEPLKGTCALRIPEERFQFLFDAAMRTLVLHSPEDVFPGPFTYKRFWFRDAAFILQAMLSAGFDRRVRRAINRFPSRQTRAGYFLSQDGEWDSNGEALWIIARYCELTGETLGSDWRLRVQNAATWITKKRVSKEIDAPHAGLLPAGFSAEHLGPNDFYYWDDFWAAAGLDSAALLFERWGDLAASERLREESRDMMRCVESSIGKVSGRRRRAGVPASPYRRMDAGAIGSLVAGYPLKLWDAKDQRLIDTVNFLLSECFLDNAFYQEITHSGLNAYLTLHVAQVLLAAGDRRFLDLMTALASMASSTGQWPEAIHPRTRGGCMGDGEHVWAAAEWVQMVRNCFVREEKRPGRLVLCSGIPAAWLEQNEPIELGPTLTPYGPISVFVEGKKDGNARVSWKAEWRGNEPNLEIDMPGFRRAEIRPGQVSVELQSEKAAA